MRNPLPPHGAGDQDRNFRPLTTAVDKRGVSSRSQGACALRREGWACKLASASCPITVHSSQKGQAAAARAAATVPRPRPRPDGADLRNLWSPWPAARQHV